MLEGKLKPSNASIACQNSPVLVLGFIPRIVTAIARSLHRHGIPVDVGDFVLRPLIRSRAICKSIRLTHPDIQPGQFVNELVSLIQQNGYDMLIPADDQALTAVMRHYDHFKDLLFVACPHPAITRRVLNKSLTLECAAQCGILVPQTVLVSNSLQLHEHARSISFPWILKPAEKEQHEGEIKSCRINRAEEIAARFPEPCRFVPPMLLQEFCEGHGVGVEFLMHNGECKAVFQHRRLKEFPFRGGMAVTAVSEAPEPALVEQSLALLRALKWDGVAMVEFRVNPAEGHAVLMEVNGRYWGTVSLPIMAGFDFPFYHWQLVHGEAPRIPTSYAAGVKWRWAVGYFARLHGILAASLRSTAARKALGASLSDILSDFSPAVHDPEFEVFDPMPTAIDFARTMRHLLSCDISAVLRRLPSTRTARKSAEVA